MKSKITVGKGGILTYRYNVSSDFGFAFHMLCEVGEPWQPEFKAMIAKTGMKIETRELDHPPWMADFLINQEESK
jgi:hypothetical protein